MSELNHIEQAIEQTQLDVAFEAIALHALTPLQRANDCGHNTSEPRLVGCSGER